MPQSKTYVIKLQLFFLQNVTQADRLTTRMLLVSLSVNKISLLLVFESVQYGHTKYCNSNPYPCATESSTWIWILMYRFEVPVRHGITFHCYLHSEQNKKKGAAMQMTVFCFFFGLDLKLQPIIRAAAMVGCLGLLFSTLSACLQHM